jgi:hypothetical protein
MPNKRISLACTTIAFAALGLAAACSSNNNNNGGSSSTNNTSTSGQNSSGSTSSGSSGTSSATGSSTAAGLTIDDQSSTGSAISLKAPSGESPGTWFTYGSDSGSQTTPGANGQAISPKQYAGYTFAAITPAAMPTGGPTISKAACLSSSGFDGYSVGEGFHFVAKLPAGAGPDSGIDAQPVPYDVSAYTGISFWAMGASDAGAYQFRVKFPDDQTDGDPFAAPGNPYGNPPSACYGDSSTDTSLCFDDFSEDLAVPSTWSQVTIKFATDLGQHAFGEAFAGGIDLHHVYGIEFEVEGLGAPGGDAGLAPGFNFCVAQIAFTQ